jgi:hypothetical protein
MYGLSGISWCERGGQWDVTWYLGTWRQVTHFNILHYWPRGTYGGLDEVDRPLALEAALKAAVAFRLEKKQAGQIRKPAPVYATNSVTHNSIRMDPLQHNTMQDPANLDGSRQSGVLGISWWKHTKKKEKPCWRLRYYDKLQNNSRKTKLFKLLPHLQQGKGFEEACSAALEEAKSCRAELVSKGIIKDHNEAVYRRHLKQSMTRKSMKGRKGKFLEAPQGFLPRSSLRGLAWHKTQFRWQVNPKFSKVLGVTQICTFPANPSQATVSESYQELCAKVRKIQQEHGLSELSEGHVIF